MRAALMRIRLKEEDRYIWIDALSIDQANTEERNHQVRMMGNIYKNAENVIVWLGLAKDDSDLAMKTLADSTRLEQYVNDVDNAELTSVDISIRLKRYVKDIDDARHIAILAFYGRSYWNRVWVQQEMYLAKRFMVYCGSKCISDEDLDLAICKMNCHNRFFYGEDFQTNSIYKLMDRKRAGSIDRAVQLHCWLKQGLNVGLESSEPRDFIYAMLGISIDCQNGELLPNYGKPLLDVYLETVAFCKLNSTSYQYQLAKRLGLTYN